MRADGSVHRDQALRSAVLAGDQHAWQTWYNESYDELYRYVYWRCAGLQDRTDEIMQETWLVALRRLRTYDPHQGRFLDWLRGIAANVLKGHLRRSNSASQQVQLLATEPSDGDAAGKANADLRRTENVIATLDALPERYDAVLRAKYLDGSSVCEIAEATGQTPKAVESLLSRARQAFRKKYEKLESNGKLEG